MKVPCKGCKERNADCHSICERYAEFVKANEELKKKKKMHNTCWGYNAEYKRRSLIEGRMHKK